MSVLSFSFDTESKVLIGKVDDQVIGGLDNVSIYSWTNMDNKLSWSVNVGKTIKENGTITTMTYRLEDDPELKEKSESVIRDFNSIPGLVGFVKSDIEKDISNYVSRFFTG